MRILVKSNIFLILDNVTINFFGFQPLNSTVYYAILLFCDG